MFREREKRERERERERKRERERERERKRESKYCVNDGFQRDRVDVINYLICIRICKLE